MRHERAAVPAPDPLRPDRPERARRVGEERVEVVRVHAVELGHRGAVPVHHRDNAQDLDLVREVAPHFRLKAARADAIIAEVRAAVRTWRLVAAEIGPSRAAQDRMAQAFRVADAGG